VAALAVTGGLSALTWRQARVWHDTSTLWSYALATAPSPIAHYNLGVFLLGRGEVPSAVDHFREALVLQPSYGAAHNNLGVAFAQQGDFVKATAHFRQAVPSIPTTAKPRATSATLGRQGSQGKVPRTCIELRHQPPRRRSAQESRQCPRAGWAAG
jgi:Tfp pilus assembly protein PilF